MSCDLRNDKKVVRAAYEARGEVAAIKELQQATGGRLDIKTARGWVLGWAKTEEWIDPERPPRRVPRFEE